MFLLTLNSFMKAEIISGHWIRPPVSELENIRQAYAHGHYNSETGSLIQCPEIISAFMKEFKVNKNIYYVCNVHGRKLDVCSLTQKQVV
jgi:hypothetical protein